ncbi:MAG: DUF4432 family protein [Caldilineaceae bacterium]|nr:DUF4432 family protein [Caldilineaceae bacterium]
MSNQPTTIHLQQHHFTSREETLVEQGALRASLFCFDSGVQALRLCNERSDLVLLPFQGQQIWSATFDGRNVTMKSWFDQPRPTTNYLDTYGGFLLHCGMASMGVPGPGDNHPLHGEIPNAPYQKAAVILGEDERGAYIGLTGEYTHAVAFTHYYVVEPVVKLYLGEARCVIGITLTNRKHLPMEYLYMAHVNFRPVDNSRFVYSAHCTPETVRVRKSIPSHVTPDPTYVAWLDELARHPEKHHTLSPTLAFDPEVVFSIDYLADETGWAHSMQVHPDGSADYIGHQPAVLNKGIRWICRMTEQDALGIVLPATADPEGYTIEKAKGNIRSLPPGASFSCVLEAGVLSAAEAQQMEAQIEQILHR